MRDGFKTKRIIMRDYSKYDGIPSICTLEHVLLLTIFYPTLPFVFTAAYKP
jgi:hypothetical protein